MVVNEMTGWLAQKQDRRHEIRWLFISILIHLPFTPLGPLFGLLTFLTRPEPAEAPIEQLNGIPVELLEQPQQVGEVKTDPRLHSNDQPAAEATVVAQKKTKPKRKEPTPTELDAGQSEDAGSEERAVATLDASARAEIAMNFDAGPDASTAIVQVPLANSEDALSAATRGIADSNANVRLNLFMDRVRQQPLGANLGQLLKSVYQWRDFFAPGGLDPVRDFDHILVFGPQLRDSSQVAAFLQHNVRAARIHGAIDRLIKHSGTGSSWLKGTRNPAARAVADRAQRLFVMYPGQVVAVVPLSVEKDALALPAFKLPTTPGDELASAYVKAPWRALLGSRFQLSKTISSATVRAYPEADGGTRLEAVLEDESSEAAQLDSKQIKRDVDTITFASNWLLSGSRIAEPLQVRVDGKAIHAVLLVTRRQAELILSIAEAWLTPEGRRAARGAQLTAAPDAGLPGTTSLAPERPTKDGNPAPGSASAFPSATPR